ncbi:MAG: SDR family NAD(P)-dependent oxidoreductase [Blastocatellia bacterium]
MKSLKEKVILVTGASKGMGAAIAKKLASEGAKVVVNYGGDKEGADAVVDAITAAGGTAVAIQTNVADRKQLKGLFQAVLKKYGKLDVLVNNAGVYQFRPLPEIDETDFDKQFSINVKGLLFACQEAASAFGDHGGSIINIGSLSSRRPGATATVYSATKAAVEAITKSLAAELAPREILVNCVLPGATETEGLNQHLAGAKDYLTTLIPLGRLGRPEEVANVVAFLASDESSWMTGELVGVGGGMGL